ncbi:MAG: ABC-2 family transporter protein [Planctomycetales bacterium]|nr:ABC-2 family transporter protein [bacterium]UNM09030.1 MAG: ABC-2 family transporter protein [Planctomycetales bacterium]
MSTVLSSIGNALSMCWHYGLQKQKVEMSYRADFIIQTLLSLVHIAVQLFFITALFFQVKDLQGWELPELVLMYGVARIANGWFNVTFFDMAVSLSDHYIIDGNLDRPLLRPLSPLFQVVLESLSFRNITQVITGTAIALWAFANVEPRIPLTVGNFLMLQAFGLLGSVVFAGVFLTIASISFWIKDRVGFTSPLFTISEASRYPLTIYAPWVQYVFTLVIPFGFCAFYPAVYFIEPQRWQAWLLAGPLVASASFAFGSFMFYRGLRVYESTGS